MTTLLSRALALWLPFLAAITGLFLFSYLAVQQEYRQSLNDPQIQIAEDGAARLSAGGLPAELVQRGAAPVDLAASLDTWIGVYDSAGHPLESSGVFDGAPPQLPASLFDQSTWRDRKTFSAPSGPETRITWQPAPGVRQAVVLVRSKDGSFVAAGRSMRAVEDRIAALTQIAAVAWSVTALGVFAVLFVLLILGWL